MELGLEGRTAVITGAGNGIGAATAAFFAREGAAVAILDRDVKAAGSVKDVIVAASGKAIALDCDVTDAKSVSEAFDHVARAFGRIDILVNNAGVVKDRAITRMADEDWTNVIDVTLKGSFLCSRAVVPIMRERSWGRIVNIASRSVFGNPGQTNYSAAKSGIMGFTRALSLECAGRGTTVNAVAPGFVETEGIKRLANFPVLRDAAVAKTPVGFLGQPDDIAAAIAFLASERARYITGTTLFVTGGRYSS